MTSLTPAPTPSIRPDPQTAQLVLSSCRRLVDREAELAERFVAHLDALNPGRSPQQQAVGAAHATELLHSILDAVRATADEELIERRWQEMGAHAYQVGYAEDGFVQVGHALVRAVRDLSGGAWSSTLSSGWMAVHVWLAAHLAVGAANARLAGLPVLTPTDHPPRPGQQALQGQFPPSGQFPRPVPAAPDSHSVGSGDHITEQVTVAGSAYLGATRRRGTA